MSTNRISFYRKHRVVQVLLKNLSNFSCSGICVQKKKQKKNGGAWWETREVLDKRTVTSRDYMMSPSSYQTQFLNVLFQQNVNGSKRLVSRRICSLSHITSPYMHPRAVHNIPKHSHSHKFYCKIGPFRLYFKVRRFSDLMSP